MDAWNSHDLDRILGHYADDIEYHSPFIAQMAEPGGPGADGRLVGQDQVRRTSPPPWPGTPISTSRRPFTVAVGSGSVSFVYGQHQAPDGRGDPGLRPRLPSWPGPLPLPGADG